MSHPISASQIKTNMFISGVVTTASSALINTAALTSTAVALPILAKAFVVGSLFSGVHFVATVVLQENLCTNVVVNWAIASLLATLLCMNISNTIQAIGIKYTIQEGTFKGVTLNFAWAAQLFNTVDNITAKCAVALSAVAFAPHLPVAPKSPLPSTGSDAASVPLERRSADDKVKA